LEQVITILKQTFESMGNFFAHTGPKLLAAIIVLVVGVLVARVAKAGLNKALGWLRFETLAGKIGMTNVLRRAEVQQTSSEILCTVAYWTLLIFTLLAALGTLGIAGTNAMTAIVDTIPQVVLAGAILVLGLNVSAFVSKLVQTAAVNSEIRQARLVRNAVHYGLSTMVVLLALRQFDISTSLLGSAFLIFFGGTCLAMALAFGLGSRDMAGEIARSKWQNEKEQSRSLSENSELGSGVLPQSTQRRQRNGRNLAA
jgi:predicted small integral membrane protein